MSANQVILINQNFEVSGEVIVFEDELMRVQVTGEHPVKRAEYVLAIYKGKQIESKVISVKADEISLLIPQLPQDYFSDRRNFPRITVDFPALLIQTVKQSHGAEENILPIRLHDLSHRGFSFTIDHDLDFIPDTVSRVIVQSEQLPIYCDIITTNEIEQFGRKRYGARIQFIHSDNIRLLYGYMFAKQV
ncbi:PilZ domain-containing protein [Paenibacillus hexagrammi]|uniref:PilZ domain-containing protein n=1 Tax=Paenibacillus hexagrammi TaxID=2908839 RepID=A0ABY3SHX5_9BACL|nr:PilZ domain-containing protein [Paenibacillus sp. YPD9-1]UJF33629.1 hypothetical protein L0M14_29810 [Paenibacillus sp. YPD9-1]